MEKLHIGTGLPIPEKKDLYYALTQIELQRAHITLTIDDFDCITEDTRYVFYNRGENLVSVLLLPARERKIQRNMKVRDFSNRNLVFIPSSASASLFEEACIYILEKSDKFLNESQKNAFKKIKKNIQPNMIKVFKYKPDPGDIDVLCEDISAILKTETFKSEEFVREISPMVELLEQYKSGLYYPLVALPEPLESLNYTLIMLSVERLREYLSDRWERFKTVTKFGLLGRFTFSSEPKLHPNISNHVRIYAPDGLLIRDVEFDLDPPGDSYEKKDILKELEKDLNKKKKEYFDERCFYIQLGPEESTIMYKSRIHFNITFGLSKKGLHLGLLPSLSLFLWLTIISPIFFRILRSPVFILMLLTLSITILVAIGIYAIDKKIVNHFIITQVILAFLIFVGEILLFIIYT